MNQKEEIIQKLFNDEPLLHEELIFISYNLGDENKEKIIPYNHEEKDIFNACGVTKADADRMNKKFSEMMAAAGETSSISNIVERAEILMNSDASFKRLVLIQAVKFTLEKQVASPLKDFLDHLDKLKRKLDKDEDDDK